ncbi:selenium-dependent xanthine dehydrogenase [Oscillibacter sp.]|jgi:aldehyde oxidoreductase|uniref:selenium-dependent xanthine dehydrogenase n=1 Tax=Oscillibacter sp. TaxID=1945593 RepID=UPI00216EDD1B|nr:selenium-dependent xanthine dehydrogenase [Oscillibacter sp.]MCI9649932.1 selenium-dependent xanthine dehydrogenase [Oscillibacter sp.]
MATFTVNGRTVTVEKNQKLLRYLRDTLGLTSVKDGCSEGACGTCTVLIDGRPTKACVPLTDKLEGKAVLTVEGLSAFEREVYTYAFGRAGAVQCGFCIPGMVISAKALLDKNLNPTREEAAFAIRNNICRCTGYVKIIDAILLAAELFRSGEVPQAIEDWSLGARVPRVDVEEKVTGTGVYPDDVHMDGMIFGSAVRSEYPRARVLAVHTEEAKALPGVVGVFTAANVPGSNKVGHLKQDWDTMIAVGDITHYLGDAICLVAAETPEILAQAKALVKVDYEELPMVRSPREAMLPDAPLVHREGNLLTHKHIQRGNPAEAIAKSKYMLTQRFYTPWTEHAFLEPECAVAYPDGDGVMVLSTDQGAYDTQHEIMTMLGWPAERVKVRNCLVGGGFGGKEDVTVQHHAALIACLTGRAVKVKLTRAESLLIHPKRHPMEMEFSLGCDENGIIQGVAAEVIADTGAYASLGGPVLERACTHAAGPYNYQNFEIDGWAYYTNNPPAGAFRGFGVTQTCFCIESLLNRMADLVGITPWEIRYRNAIRPGQELPNGQIVDGSTGLVETLEAVKPYYDGAKCVGLACAMKNAGVGVGIPDTGRVRLTVEDGRVHIFAGASCIGQGLGTVLTQMVCDQTGLGPDQVVYERSNTYFAPDSGTTSGSRQTLFTGEACRRACQDLREALAEGGLEALNGREFRGEYLGKTDPLGADVPNPVSHIAYGYSTQICILDEDGKIQQMVAAHDVGRAVNPLSVEGQIEGGVVMSMGFALTERYPLVDCKPTAKYGTLGLFRANQIPDITAIVVEKEGLDVACGAIGVGEITSIPTAPAIADAYYRYDGKFRTTLPLEDTPYTRK